MSDLEDFLAQRSGLTETQVRTLKMQKLVMAGELTVKTAANTRGGKPVRLGAYYRVLDQARVNVEEAIYTLLLCERLDLIKLEDLRRLLDLVSKRLRTLDDEESQRVASVIDALISRIVML